MRIQRLARTPFPYPENDPNAPYRLAWGWVIKFGRGNLYVSRLVGERIPRVDWIRSGFKASVRA